MENNIFAHYEMANYIQHNIFKKQIKHDEAK